MYQAASALVNMPYDEIVDYVALAPGIQEEFMLPHRFLEHLRTAPRVYLQVQAAFQLSTMPFLDIIERWKELARQITSFFCDQKNVEFILVAIPEALGVYQSQRVIGDLEAHGLDVRHMIVNNVVVRADCDFHRQRMEMQRPYLELLKNEYGGRMTLTPLTSIRQRVYNFHAS